MHCPDCVCKRQSHQSWFFLSLAVRAVFLDTAEREGARHLIKPDHSLLKSPSWEPSGSNSLCAGHPFYCNAFPPARVLWLSSLLTSPKTCPSSADKTPSPPIAKLGTRLISFLHWASYSTPKLSFFISSLLCMTAFQESALWLNISCKNFAEWKIIFICFAPSTQTLVGEIHCFISSTCKYHLQSLVKKIHCFCMAELQHQVCNFRTGRHCSSLFY